MESGHGHTESCGRFHGVGDGVGDVVELEIEENLAPARLHGFDDRGALCGKKFEADLAENRWLTQGVEEAEGPVGVGNIEGDDDFVLGSGRSFHTMGLDGQHLTHSPSQDQPFSPDSREASRRIS